MDYYYPQVYPGIHNDLKILRDLVQKFADNHSLMLRQFDNLQHSMFACSLKINEAQACFDVPASLEDKVTSEEDVESEINFDLVDGVSSSAANPETPLERFEISIGNSFNSIPFAPVVLSIGCTGTIDTSLETKTGDDKNAQEHEVKVFDESPPQGEPIFLSTPSHVRLYKSDYLQSMGIVFPTVFANKRYMLDVSAKEPEWRTVPFLTGMTMSSNLEEPGVASYLLDHSRETNGPSRCRVVPRHMIAQRMLIHFPFDPGLVAKLCACECVTKVELGVESSGTYNTSCAIYKLLEKYFANSLFCSFEDAPSSIEAQFSGDQLRHFRSGRVLGLCKFLQAYRPIVQAECDGHLFATKIFGAQSSLVHYVFTVYLVFIECLFGWADCWDEAGECINFSCGVTLEVNGDYGIVAAYDTVSSYNGAPLGNSSATLSIVTFYRMVMVICICIPKINFNRIRSKGHVETMATKLLLVFTVEFCSLENSNSMTKVWDPGWHCCVRFCMFVDCAAASQFVWHSSLTVTPKDGYGSIYIRPVGDWSRNFKSVLSKGCQQLIGINGHLRDECLLGESNIFPKLLTDGYGADQDSMTYVEDCCAKVDKNMSKIGADLSQFPFDPGGNFNSQFSSNIKRTTTSFIVSISVMLYSNLEDKVLIEEGGIVVNWIEYNEALGPATDLHQSPGIKQPNARLLDYLL